MATELPRLVLEPLQASSFCDRPAPELLQASSFYVQEPAPEPQAAIPRPALDWEFPLLAVFCALEGRGLAPPLV